jgi:hypothetical protein
MFQAWGGKMLLALNWKRRIILVAYLLAMAAASAYVPWVIFAEHDEYSNGYNWITKTTHRDLLPPGPHFINPNQISAPGHKSPCEKFPKMKGCSSGYLPQVPKYLIGRWVGTVNYGRLAIEYIGITAIFLALLIALPKRPCKSDSAGPNP